jgi:hypothetical protein
LGPRDLVFVNGLCASSSLGALKISVTAIELGSRDDFWVSSEAFFVNYFYVSSILCALKISASGVELGSRIICGTAGTQFLSTVSPSALVYLSRRCQRQP